MYGEGALRLGEEEKNWKRKWRSDGLFFYFSITMAFFVNCSILWLTGTLLTLTIVRYLY